MPAVFKVGGGDGATATAGDIPRRIAPVRVLWLVFGLEIMTGFVVVVVAGVLLDVLGVRGRRFGAGVGDANRVGCGLGAGSLAVTADDGFLCVAVVVVVFVFVKNELNFFDKLERIVSVGWIFSLVVCSAIGCVKVLDVRLAILAIHSLGVDLFDWILIVDVCNCSLTFEGIGSAL